MSGVAPVKLTQSLRSTRVSRLGIVACRAGFCSSAIARSAGGFPSSVSSQKQKTFLPPYAPVGVAAARAASPSSPATPTLFEKEFSLSDRVALVSGANRGLGLEMSMALVEAGARVVYCLDLPQTPGDEFEKVKRHVRYFLPVAAEALWKVGESIGNKEGRMDVCICAAGIVKPGHDCLDYPAQMFNDVMDVDVNGVLYTAQAAGRQMARFGNGGSIILIASISGSITNMHQKVISYNTSKSAVLQMGRSMACELAPKHIRVNTLSPGYIYTALTAAFIDSQPGLREEWSSQNPQNRLGRPDELRGVVTWLASDASTYCTGSDIIVDGGHRAW
ncbi:NAD(P)-binding protein [Laetiporus sulphureus 93-53]|uniref:NAD(P)-binding protein n=1 Tax=Laetiporus sulphureus 93-53 TaxID=1314785 RepID=A0A165E277_9APHY|nr:NAD(P)-binding protein [Laetiporus sulphureus 93-53]KZT06103.1 NAD(P)-binding protein [Laetiporus sulphureus 93-53]